MSIRLVLRAFIIAVFGLTTVAGAFSLPASAADRPVPLACITSMDSPHVSAGAGGVIAKLRYCDPDGVHVNVTLLLYLCPNKPSSNEQNWANEGCVLKAYAFHDWNANAAQQYTKYVPDLGNPGQHGTGWWVACASFSQPSSWMLPSVSRFLSA